MENLEKTAKEKSLEGKEPEFNPEYEIFEEYFDSLKCRCSCNPGPGPGPYCRKEN